MYDNEEHVVPLIWQGDTANQSPNYSQRKTAYNVSGIPHAVFNGFIHSIGGGTNMYPIYRQHYNTASMTDSPIDMTIEMSVNQDGNLMATAEVEMVADGFTSNNKIVFIVTRKITNEYFCSVTYYEHQDFNLIASGDTGSYQYVIPENDYALDDLSLAVFIQTWDDFPEAGSHTIVQARYYPFTDLLNPMPTNSLDFGTIEVGESSTLSFTITNFWETVLSATVFPVSNFDIVSNFTVAPGETNSIEITFTPAEATIYESDIIIMTNIEAYPLLTLHVRGEGYSTSADENLNHYTKAKLLGNSPNPFSLNTNSRNGTEIKYEISKSCNVRIDIYNSKGQKINTLINQTQQPNTYSILWNGKDDRGVKCVSGIYYYTLKTDDMVISKKMILIN